MESTTETFVRKFHDIVTRRDADAIGDFFAEGAVLHTPRFLRPITDRGQLITVLRGILLHVEGFDYHRIFIRENEAVMEFKGRLGEVVVHGVDIFTLDEAGKVKELTVMIRPTKALAAIGEMEDRFFQGLQSKAKQA